MKSSIVLYSKNEIMRKVWIQDREMLRNWNTLFKIYLILNLMKIECSQCIRSSNLLLQFPMGGIRNPERGSDVANGKGRCPKAKWNCCCCPRKEITMSKMKTVHISNHERHKTFINVKYFTSNYNLAHRDFSKNAFLNFQFCKQKLVKILSIM